MILITSAFLITCFFSGITFADTPAKLQPYIISQDYSPNFVKMIPSKSGEGYAAAFRLLNDGTSRKLWSIDGYSFEAYLSKDGQYFIRLGPWASGRKPSHKDVAVEFFKNGQLLRSYSTKDLVKDVSKVVPTAGHYFWRKKDKNYPLDSALHFYIKTVDDLSYVFDITTGEITSD